MIKKRAALTEIIYYWYERQQTSLAALMDILEHKMGMDFITQYKDCMNEDAVRLLGSCVTRKDFDKVIGTLRLNLVDTSKLAQKLDIKEIEAIDYEPHYSDRTRSQLQHLLEKWISEKKENATWGRLIGIVGLIDKVAAKRIKAQRMSANPVD